MRDILPTVNAILKLPKQKDSNKPVLPSTSKSWSKVRIDMKAYLTDVIQVGLASTVRWFWNYGLLFPCKLQITILVVIATFLIADVIKCSGTNNTKCCSEACSPIGSILRSISKNYKGHAKGMVFSHCVIIIAWQSNFTVTSSMK